MPYGYKVGRAEYSRGRKRATWSRSQTASAKSKRSQPRRPRRIAGVRFNRKNSKLLDKKINTATEVACLRIAKAEIEKNLKINTKRNYLFHTYDLETNEFAVLLDRPDLIDWTGQVVELSNIAKTDAQTLPNQPQADDPLTGNLDENNDLDGPNQIMLGQDISGERWTDIVYVKSLSAQVRLRSFMLDTDDLDLFQTIKIKYAFILVQDDEATMMDVNNKPDANEMLFMQPFGYGGAKLDKELSFVFTARKRKVLCSGQTILNMNNDQTSEKFHSIYKKFDKPIQIVYPARDQNGQQANKKIYFVCRSTIPADSGYDGVKPSLYACCKINYYEA